LLDIHYPSKPLSQILSIPLKEPLIFGGSPSLEIYFFTIFLSSMVKFPP
jgi:hypothetical protein